MVNMRLVNGLKIGWEDCTEFEAKKDIEIVE